MNQTSSEPFVRPCPSAEHAMTRVAATAALACCLLIGTGVQAQALSSPLGEAPSKNSSSKGGASAGSGTLLGLPAGQGPGIHGANSPFPQLEARNDVVPWSVLTSVKTKNNNNRVLPIFNMGQMALNQKLQRIQGYMMPLEPGEKQRHFLLSSVPLTCAFCVPGGPESMVEVNASTPVKYSMEPLVVEGRFVVLNDDDFGLYYRLTGAKGVQ